jgi:modification methylase
VTEPTGKWGSSVLTSVWPTGDEPLKELFAAHGYDASIVADSKLFPPDAAKYAISSLTRPGAVVLDPDCGCGTVPVEAVRAGRHGVGLTPYRSWWRVARANVNAAKAGGAAADGMVLSRPSRDRPVWPETAGLKRRVDLLLTSLRPSRSDGGIERSLHRLLINLGACRRLLKPGAHVVVLAPLVREAATGALVDVGAGISVCGRAANLAVVGRCVAPKWPTSRPPIGSRTSVGAYNVVVVMRSDPDLGEPTSVDEAFPAAAELLGPDLSMAA